MQHFYERAPTPEQIAEEYYRLNVYYEGFRIQMQGLPKYTKEYKALCTKQNQVYVAMIALQWAFGGIIKTPLRCFETGTTKLEDTNA